MTHSLLTYQEVCMLFFFAKKGVSLKQRTKSKPENKMNVSVGEKPQTQKLHLQNKVKSLYVLAVSTFDIVAGSWVEHRDSQILIDLLPHRATLNLLKHGRTGRQFYGESTSNETSDRGQSAVQTETHIVKASQFVHQPVELEQVQVPVSQNRPLVDGSSCGGEPKNVRFEENL